MRRGFGTIESECFRTGDSADGRGARGGVFRRASAFIRFRSVTGGRASAYFRGGSFAFIRIHPLSFAYVRIQFFFRGCGCGPSSRAMGDELGNFCRVVAKGGARHDSSRQIHRKTSRWQAYSTAIRRNTSQKKYFRRGNVSGRAIRLRQAMADRGAGRTFRSGNGGQEARGMNWSQWPGLNRRPTVYETVALPLSYIGLTVSPASHWAENRFQSFAAKRPRRL